MKNYILHMDRPAAQWDDATPIGSGSQGLMIWGAPAREQLTWNEESIWSGGPMDTRIPGFREAIDGLRQLFLEGREFETPEYVAQNLKDMFLRIRSYEFAGNVYASFPALREKEITDYRRDLDLINGKAEVSFTADGVRYTREAFASHPAGLLCTRFTADAPFETEISFERVCIDKMTLQPGYIVTDCHTDSGDNKFRTCIKIDTDGKQYVHDGAVCVSEATWVVLYMAAFTSFRHDCIESASAAGMMKAAAGWDALLAEHTADFRPIMERSDIDFSASAGEDLEGLTVSRRLERLKEDPAAADPGLLSLYYQFGKYLLVSSSREDTLPANLQGLWTEKQSAPWNADYHTNINLQMNYWHAEQAGLTESVKALFDYMNNYLLPGGKKAASENYGARGMVVHHVSDIYGFAAAADGPWGLWPVGGAWMAFHMWEHYLYTGDTDFLKNTAYEYIRQCALFFMDTLFEDENGMLLSGPSTSPENSFWAYGENGEKKKCYICVSPTMDTEIIGGLLRFYKETEDILQIHPEDGETAAKMADKLPPLSVGKHGQLMEWYKDYDEVEPGHRHVSHAFGLYPAAQITRATPELYDAIRVTMDRRLASGGGHTGWSRAWLINMFARLRDGRRTYENIRALFTRSTLPNLFDTHPPFQIDGNFGGAAGIGEMVMQSHEGFISLLPALDESLADGSFTGLRARDRYIVDAAWEKGVVTSFTVRREGPFSVDVELPCGCGIYRDSSGREYRPVDNRIHLEGCCALTLCRA